MTTIKGLPKHRSYRSFVRAPLFCCLLLVGVTIVSNTMSAMGKDNAKKRRKEPEIHLLDAVTRLPDQTETEYMTNNLDAITKQATEAKKGPVTMYFKARTKLTTRKKH